MSPLPFYHNITLYDNMCKMNCIIKPSNQGAHSILFRMLNYKNIIQALQYDFVHSHERFCWPNLKIMQSISEISMSELNNHLNQERRNRFDLTLRYHWTSVPNQIIVVFVCGNKLLSSLCMFCLTEGGSRWWPLCF